MKKIQFLFTSLVLVLLPFLANGQSPSASKFLENDGGPMKEAIKSVITFMQGVLIPFLLAIGFFMLVWGVIKYFVIGGDNDDAKASGKSLIIYAIAGFVVILAFWGIVNIISSGIGLEGKSLEAIPQAPTVK